MCRHIVNWLKFILLVFFLPELLHVSDSERKEMLCLSFISCTHRWYTIDDLIIFFPDASQRTWAGSFSGCGLKGLMSSGTWFQSSLWAQMKASPSPNIIEIQESLFISEKEMGKKPSGAGLSSVWVPGCLSVPSFLLAFPFLLWIWNMVGCVWLCKSFLSLAAIGAWRLTARSIPARTLGSSQTATDIQWPKT